MINFIPNDPLVINVLPMRRVSGKPNRPAGRAGVHLADEPKQASYPPGSPEFVAWQARQAAILAIEAWEKVLGKPLTSWALEADNPASLLLIPDAGDDLNAYYDRATLSFFHASKGNTTWFSGASTDVVAHEAGHAILDALRPDLWGVNLLEVGGFHEAFGDVSAIVTALADRKTREALLKISPKLDKANFVEATAEELSDAIRQFYGAGFSASQPRRALNTFTWQLPQTMPKTGGPNVMIAEVHSIARIMSGCFYDVLRGVFVQSGKPTQTSLWTATKIAAALFYEAARTAPAVPRFFRAVGKAMVLADEQMYGGKHRDIINQAFLNHGLALGADAYLAAEMALAGTSPKVRRNEVTVEESTIQDLRSRFAAGSRKPATVSMVELGGAPMANVTLHSEVSLDAVDPRLKGVVAAVNTATLVGSSGGSAALMAAPRSGAPAAEVVDFVSSLVTNNQIAFDAAAKAPKKSAVPAAKGKTAPGLGTTHAVRKRGAKQELERVRFACGWSAR
jgi:hypothetical protein